MQLTSGARQRARALLRVGFMTFYLRTTSLILSGLGLLVACSGEASSEAADPASGDVELQLEAARQKLLATDAGDPASASYFELRRDLRRCAAPLCGGFFVQSVNRLSTVCADGTRSAECYVMELDLSALGLSDDQIAQIEAAPEDVLLRGELGVEDTTLGQLGVLNVSEAWSGHAGVDPTGPFLRVKDAGIVCITSPCLSFSAELLDIPRVSVPVAEVDVSGIGDDTSDAFSQLNEPDGLVVAGWPEIVRGPGGRALGIDASEYYVPITATSAVCGSRGLPECAEGSFCAFPSDADCGRADAPGSCAIRPEACILIFDPVCGCDGQTYGNSCQAASAGVSVDFDGACEDAK
jgi:hypothetical protein